MQNKQCNYALLIFIGPPEVPFIFIKVHLVFFGVLLWEMFIIAPS